MKVGLSYTPPQLAQGCSLCVSASVRLCCPESEAYSGMERAAKKNNNAAKFQLCQPESHPIQLINIKWAYQKLDYMHYNPVEAGFVVMPEDWKYSSAIF